MVKVTFYPLGNADCCLIRLNSGALFVLDYADMHNPIDKGDKRIPLRQNFKEDIGWPDQKEVDVLAITHGDNDHVKGIPDAFWLEHAQKYQGNDRVKFKELWVPAALIVEEGSEDDTKIVRAEARHRFLAKKGIRVFARPEHLRDWLKERGKKLEHYTDLITDAGRLVPGWTLNRDGIEFFVHSPFAERTQQGLLDRNDNCLVMQAVIRVDGRDTRFLITADSVAENWERIVSITDKHGNRHRLEWDIFKVPHHCSYRSMAKEKGAYKTEPIPEFESLLNRGAKRSVMISTSWEIPSGDTDDNQPPHVQTYRRYKETADGLEADLVVTMENPSRRQPKRTIVSIDGNGSTLKKEAISGAVAVISSRPPRMG